MICGLCFLSIWLGFFVCFLQKERLLEKLKKNCFMYREQREDGVLGSDCSVKFHLIKRKRVALWGMKDFSQLVRGGFFHGFTLVI